MFVELLISLCSELKRLNQMQETVAKPAGLCMGGYMGVGVK